MADKSISQLSPGVAVTDTDLLPNVQVVGVGPVKTTAVQIKTYVNTNPNVTGVIRAQLGSAGAPSYTFDGDTNTGWWSPAADTLAASTNGTERIRLTSAGSVGIGTNNPAIGLSVYNASTATLGVQTAASGVASSDGFQLQLAGTTGYVWNYENDAIVFGTNSSERARITAAGNVGIGTASPQARLQVLDALKVSSADQSQGRVILGDGSSANFGVGIARWNGATNAGGAGGIGYFAQGPSNAGGHFFYIGDAGAGSTTEIMRINSSGNVGIGTAGPTGKLSVSGGNVDVTSGDVMLLTTARKFSWNVSGQFFSWIESDGVVGNNFMRFAVANTERMRIDSAGNVGIGVTPSAWSTSYRAVDIGSGAIMAQPSGNDIYVTQNAYFDGAWKYRFSSTLSSRYQQVGGAFSWHTAPSGSIGATISFTQAMTLAATGNLGVGTTNPATWRVSISQAGDTSLQLSNSSGDGNRIFLSDQTWNAEIYHLRGELLFRTGGANTRVVIDGSGNVAIGNTVPRALLHVGTTTTTTDLPIPAGNFILVRNGNYANGQTAGIQLSGGYGDGGRVGAWQVKAVGSGAAGVFTTDLIFSTQNSFSGSETERMRFDSFGNVGIGVTPSAWNSSYRSLAITTGASIASATSSSECYLSTNAFLNSSSSWVYIASAAASQYRQAGSIHSWHIAASGTAANAISFTQAMTLNASGNLSIGTTSSFGALSVVKGVAGAEVARFHNADGFGIRIIAQVGGSGGKTAIRTAAGESISLETNTTERMLVDATGNVIVNTAAIATNATDGFLYVSSCAGTPTGTPTAYAGRVPIVVDTTNNKLYFYSGGAWRDAGP